ncbi:hypothetical protein Osc7112_1618 [Oscillatoria nigro-viridis PCC 7112]|uniref:Uncharacterized protein n=1 Tax=Phormidium nigroviride PCC 7112 TaxID=179408 RepID=K9VDY7_9CYAN|nr:hypothetical protein [Oscillatoria nigro-viridis]AFZ06126.1 hypothetical protein Osc7112_1618 [Oscillatoria nigro-viridis PCC 7112]
MSDSKAQELKLQLEQVIKNSDNDKLYNGGKAVINLLPGGSLASYIYETYVKSPANQRLDNFLLNLVDAIKEIEDKVESFSADSPIFQTALISALSTAMRHHQEQELAALRNTVLNAGLPNAPEADIQRMFLNWLDEFTSWHLMLLRYLHEGTYNDLQLVRDDLELKRPFYNQVLQDLNAKGLIQLKEVYVTKEKNEKYERQFGSLGIPLPIPQQIISGYELPYRDTNLVSFKKVEDIDAIVRKSEYYYQYGSQASKIERVTDVGKLFLDFIKNPLKK